MIPRIIHYIPLSTNDIASFIENTQPVLSRYPSIVVWIWLFPDTTESLQHNTPSLPSPYSYQFISSDMVSELAYYEIEQIHPNRVAFRNLLRYEILYRFGGISLDERFDIKKISDDYFANTAEKNLYIDSTLLTDPVHANQTIISTPNHPVLAEIISRFNANYTLLPIKEDSEVLGVDEDEKQYYFQTLSNMNLPHELAYLYEDWNRNAHRNELVEYRTGIYFLQSILLECGNKNDINNIISFSLNERISNSFRINSIAIDDWEKRINQTIWFEALHFHLFRLDDYILYLIKYIKMNEEQAFEFLKNSFNKLLQEGLDLNNIICIKITYLYPHTLQWCKELNFQKSYLIPGIHNAYLVKNAAQFNYYKSPVLCVFNINQYAMCYQILNATGKDEIVLTLEKMYISHATFLHDVINTCEHLLPLTQKRQGAFSYTIEAYLQHVIMILNLFFEIHHRYPIANAILEKNPPFQLLVKAKQRLLDFSHQNNIIYKSYSL